MSVFVVAAAFVAGLVFPCGAAGVDAAAAARYSGQCGGDVLLVTRRGRVAFEWYRAGCGPDVPVSVHSITKSLCALGALAAVRDGLLDFDAVPEGGVAIGDLLRQVSGLDPGHAVIYRRPPGNTADALETIPRGTAGEFAYGPSHYEMLALLLEGRLGTGAAGPGRHVRKALFGPLGIRGVAWRTDGRGASFFSAGMRMTPRQLAVAGRLVARRGWHGLRRLLPGRLVAEALRGSEANPAYGMGFWLNANARKPGARPGDIEHMLASNPARSGWSAFCLSKLAPPDLVAMAGSGGQRVYVVPSMDLVVVRLGSGRRFADNRFLDALFGNGKLQAGRSPRLQGDRGTGNLSGQCSF